MALTLSTLQNELRIVNRLAAASYCNNIFTTNTFSCGWSCTGEATGTQLIATSRDTLSGGAAFVAVNHGTRLIFVSFRGSDNIQDWIINTNFWKSTGDYAVKAPEFLPALPAESRVHAGFELQYLRIRDRLLTPTVNLARQYPTYRIMFVGHSLGGALATLGSAEFVVRNGFGDRVALYTLGAPRVGNQKFVDFITGLPFASRIFRIHRKGDPISFFPPRWLGYQHTFQMYQIQDNKTLTMCQNEPGSSESLSCLSNLPLADPARHHDYYSLPMC
jgi:predicted lipase